MDGRLLKGALALAIGLWWLVVPAAAQPPVGNPDLFEKSLEAARQALEYYGRYQNPGEEARLTEIGYRLAQESLFQDFPYTFYLIDMPEPNAFALPGGQIFVTRGMLDVGLTDDMLAGLLGHEIGHVALQHGVRMQRKATLLNVLSQALLVGVMIGASDNDGRGGVYDPYGRNDSGGDLIQGTAAAGAVISELLLRDYSREFEDEADDDGQRLAAGAGFDPEGTRLLMDALRARLPQSREYGYWRTHPFFEDRVRSAGVREGMLKIQEPEPADAYRAETQARLLAFAGRPGLEAAETELLRHQALVAWPQGRDADKLRLAELKALRDEELEKAELSRDFGRIVSRYAENLDEVRRLTPESPLIETLEKEIASLGSQRDALYPKAAAVFEEGVFQTEFLATFLANYPGAPEAPAVALALGEAYRRLDRQADAVARYLEAWDKDPEGEIGARAARGLRALAPGLERLGALQRLADQDRDPELRSLAEQRLSQLARKFKDPADGAAYLDRFSDRDHAAAVNERLNEIAQNLLTEVILYQTVGDQLKALDRIQKILKYAPLSPAADQLRERMVLKG